MKGTELGLHLKRASHVIPQISVAQIFKLYTNFNT